MGWDLVVIGGGLVGLTSSIYLSRRGLKVIVLDKGGPSASVRNAGLVVPSMYYPLPLSFSAREALKALLCRGNPARITHRAVGNLKWFHQLVKSRRRLSELPWRALRRAGEYAIKAVEEVAKERSEEVELRRGEILEVYKDEKAFLNAANYANEVTKDGLRVEVLSRDEVLGLESSLSRDVAGGLRYVYDLSLDPIRYYSVLLEEALRSGVTVERGVEVSGIKTDRGGVRVLSSKGSHEGAGALIAAGPWSRGLCKRLNYDVPVAPAKGYVVELSGGRSPTTLERPLMLEELRVVASPFKDRIQLAGVLDFDGFNERYDARRVDAIVSAVRTYVPSLKDCKVRGVYTAFRPLTPDEVPLIQRLGDNLYIACGHGRFGLTFSALTGEVVSSIVLNEKPIVDVEIFKLNRLYKS